MKKDGDWIATFGADMKVRRIAAEASVMLDLVEVVELDADGMPAGIRYFDRVEAARLRDALGRALDQLERDAIERRLIHRYELRWTDHRGIRNFMAWDLSHDRRVGPVRSGPGAEEMTRREVDHFNAGDWRPRLYESAKGKADRGRNPGVESPAA